MQDSFRFRSFNGHGMHRRAAGWILMGLLVALYPAASPGQGVLYVPAYNTLVSNYNDRIRVVGGTTIACKGALDPVMPQDLDVIRQKVLTAMQLLFVVDPPLFDLGSTNAAQAFPFGLPSGGRAIGKPSLMSDIGDGTGLFTKIPAEYTHSGDAVYAASFTTVPLLWVHFTELNAAIMKLRFLVVAPGNTAWVSNGTSNYRQGWTRWVNSWTDTVAACVSSYAATPATQQNNPPTAYTASTGPYQGHSLDASMASLSSFFKVTGLYTGFPHSVRFYVLGKAPAASPQFTVVYDSQGSSIQLGRWASWSTVPMTTASNVISSAAGVGPAMAWCSQPPWGERSWRGYQSDGRAVVEWSFAERSLVRPRLRDSDDDGLADRGCTCSSCPLEARATWNSLEAGAAVSIPLGVSDGLLSGGLRVKAYLTEYEVNGSPAQMYSLSTAVVGTYPEVTEADFVAVKRPLGADVLFCLSGTKPGQAVDLSRSYRLERKDQTVTLRFPKGRTEVRHVYTDNKLVAVTMKEGTREWQVHWLDHIGSWPGLYTEYLTSPWDYQRIQYVACPGLTACASRATSTSLVTSVEYRYGAGGPVHKTAYYHGSKGFRTTDAQGATLWDTRIVTDAANGLTEIWSGISTNNGVRVLRKEKRRSWQDPESGLRMLEQTDLCDDGLPSAQSNTMLTAMATFAWGEEPVSQTLGAGRPEAMTTRYDYHTNVTDSTNYTRLKQVTEASGRWMQYAYDAKGRESKVVSGFKHAAPGADEGTRGVEHVYAGDPRLAICGMPADDDATDSDDQPRLTIETLDGWEVARTYVSCQTGRETRVRCVTPGAAYGDPGNLVSVTTWATEGDFKGRALSCLRPDGTFSAFHYSYDAGRREMTVREDSGAGAAGTVTNGIRTVTVTDAGQRVVSLLATDIATGITFRERINVYDTMGRLLCESNTLDGTVTEYEQGCCGPEVVRDADGLATTNTYDELKRLYAVERAGLTTFNKYDVQGNVVEVRSSAPGLPDRVSSSEYDAAGRMVRAVQNGGQVTEYRYTTNAAGESVTTAILADGSTQVEIFNPDGQLKCVTGTAVRAVSYDYGADEQGAYTTVFQGADTNALEWVKTYTDGLGRSRKVIYADGYAEETVYNAAGQPVRQGDGLTTRLREYNAAGDVFRSGMDMDGNGALDADSPDRISAHRSGYGMIDGRAARYDETLVHESSGCSPRTVAASWQSVDGRTRWSVTPGCTSRVEVARSPAAAARTETEVSPDGSQTLSCFTNGLLKSVSRRAASGEEAGWQCFAHDGFGRVVSCEEQGASAEPVRTEYQYDARGLVTGQCVSAGALSRMTGFEYDAMGRRVRTVLPDGGTVEHEYESTGELKAQGGTRAIPIRWGHDQMGRTAWMATYRTGTNAAADVTRWLYDDRRGWMTAKLYADGSTNRYEYRADGRMVKRTWARGVETVYSYDAAGTLTNWSYSDGTAGTGLLLDRVGRVVGVREGATVRSNRYDALGRIETESLPAGGTIGYEYDSLGRRTNLTVRAADGTTAYRVEHGFDTAGRLARIATGSQQTFFDYTVDGRAVTHQRTSVDGHDVLSVERTLDALGRLTRLAWMNAAGSVAGTDYEYNAADLRSRRTEADRSSWSYEYDDLGQLSLGTRFDPDGAPVPGARFEYSYDSIGNRQWMSDDTGSKLLYQVNAVNQYKQLGSPKPVSRIVQSGSVFKIGARRGGGPTSGVSDLSGVCEYDPDGNLIKDGGTCYAWDGENRLSMVSNATLMVSNRYDCQSRRTGKVVYSNATGDWRPVSDTRFIYDDWNLILEIRTPPEGGAARTNRFVWGTDLSGTPQGAGGIGGLLGVQQDTEGVPGAPLLPIMDAGGNVTAMSDATGSNIVARYEYDPYGNALSASGGPIATPVTPLRFSTKYLDAEAGLYYYGYRFYSPRLGRWLARDPIGEEGGVNLYGFVRNTPPNAIDPLGLALYAFDGTWNDRGKMKRPTNVAKLLDAYRGLKWYEKGVGTAWFTKHIGGATGMGGGGRIESMYAKLVEIYSTPDPTGENQKIDVIGFSRGAALARTFVNYINKKGGVELLGSDGRRSGLVCPVKIRFLGLFDTVASFGVPGNDVNWGQSLAIPANVEHVRHAVALDEKRGMFPLSSVLSGPDNLFADRRIVEMGFRGAHSDIGGGYEDGDRSNFALMWMRDEGVKVGVPFGPLAPEDIGASRPIIHDERGLREQQRDRPRTIYYLNGR